MTIKYNQYVKEPFQEEQYEPWQIEELMKCSEDIFYFIKYVTIVTLDGGRKKLDNLIYEFQNEIINLIKDNRYSIILSGRQQGKSTIVGTYALWYAIFNKDSFIGIASNKADSSKDILRRIKIIYEDIPHSWIKPGVVEYNKNSIEFDNGSRIETAATTEDTFRGRSLSLLILDEFAFVNDNISRNFFGSVYPAISASEKSKIIIISTPNGMFNLFHEIYTKAEKNKNKFAYIKVPWYRVPGRDEEWKQIQISNIGEQKFAQEYACDFLNSSSTVVNKEALEFISTQLEDPILIDLNNRLRIFEEKISNAQYIMGVDPSKGTGEHDATIQIYRIESLKPIKLINTATFQDNKTDTFELSAIINRLSIYYNNCIIFIENNGEGSTVSQNLWWVYENPNLYNSGQTENEIGIRATRSTKPKAVVTMKKLIEDFSIIIKDSATAKQLSTFKEKGNNTFTNIDGVDDLVSALYWMCYGITTEIFENIDIVKVNNIDDDAWGILSDIDDEFFIEDYSW